MHFMDLKKNRKIKLYIKNYILSSVNLINLSKLIISQQPIDDKKLAQIIEFSIFSAFKKSLKEILDKLTIINEEKLLGIKIDKIKTNKNFFIQYGIKENDAIKYSRILFWFKNIIKFFEDIFPKKISILDLELTMF